MNYSYTEDRYELAMAIRLAEKFALHEGICNHFSVAVGDDKYLINPYSTHWSEMAPDRLMLIDGDGNLLEGTGEVEDTARFIHVAGHRANERHKAIFHTHMPWATVLTMLENGRLEMAHQTAVKFHNRTAYQTEFGGLALSNDEGERLFDSKTSEPHVDIKFLANHGVVVGGATVAMAFDDLYYLERACRQQVLAMQTGSPLKLIPADIIELTCQQMTEQQEEFAQHHFSALCRVLQNNPDKHFVL